MHVLSKTTHLANTPQTSALKSPTGAGKERGGRELYFQGLLWKETFCKTLCLLFPGSLLPRTACQVGVKLNST